MTLPGLQHARLRASGDSEAGPARATRARATGPSAETARVTEFNGPESPPAPPRGTRWTRARPPGEGRVTGSRYRAAPHATRRASLRADRIGRVRDRTSGRLDHPATGEFRVG